MFATIACTEQGWSAGLPGAGLVVEHGEYVAVATTFPLMYWAGRAHYDGHRVRQRVVVFDRATRARLAVLDAARWPIQELAFRGDGHALAIACGSYDGGYLFEGELLVWDWGTGAVRRPLRANREVVRVRWIDAGRLAVLVRPENDEDGDEAFVQVHGAELADVDVPVRARVRDARVSEAACDPAAFGFDGPQAGAASTWARDGGLAAEVERRPIRDVMIVGDRIAAVDDDCLVRLWDASFKNARCITGEGCGVQLLRVGERVLVATCEQQRRTALYSIAGDELRPVRRFDRAYLFSTDTQGRLLGRDTERGAARQDVVLGADGATLQVGDFGHFDVFNHALRLDGDRLYYLRGTPAGSHERKVLMAIEADGAHREAMMWDEGSAHCMNPAGCSVDAGAVVTGFRVYDPRPGRGDGFVVRREQDGATAWRVEWPYAPVALVHAPAIDAVVVATLDGTLAALDARTGALRGEEQLTVEGVLAPPTCVAVDGRRVTVGTLDGRLVTLSL